MLQSKVSKTLVGLLIVYGLLCVMHIELSQATLIFGSVQKVITKLEAYALGKSYSTGLSIQDLKNALEEAQSWDQSEHIKRKESDPNLSLVVDFLLVPMLRYTDPTRDGVSQEPGNTVRRDYITRLEKYYKIFRPAYHGYMIGDSYHKSPKTDKLIDSLIETTGHQPLTKKMLEDADAEFKALSQRCSEIRAYDDIYSCAAELKYIFNYKNRMEVKILSEKLFPLIKSQNNLNSFKELYKSELRKRNIVVMNGKMFRTV